MGDIYSMEGLDHVLQPRMSAAGNARGTKALSISIAFTSLATCFVLFRFYARVFVVKRTGPDDWMSLVSLVCLRTGRHSMRLDYRLTKLSSYFPLLSWAYLLAVSLISPGLA